MVRTPQRVWFLVPPRTGMLNIVGPWEVLGHTNDVLGRAAYDLEACGSAAPEIRTRHGLVLGGLRPLPEDPDDLPDMVLVAGASPQDPLPDDHASFVPWLRQRHERNDQRDGVHWGWNHLDGRRQRQSRVYGG